MENKQKLLDWVKQDTYNMISIDDRYEKCVFFKQKYNERLDLIFAYDNVSDGILPLHRNPEYQGIYDRKIDKVYGAGFVMRNVIGENEYDATSEHMQRFEYQEKVRAGINKEVRKFEKDVSIDEADRNKYARHAETAAREAYLKDAENKFKYECNYEPLNFERKLINYIMEPEDTVEKSITKFCQMHHDSIVDRIKKNILTKEFYDDYMNGKDTHLSTMKKIIKSIPNECKTVNVTTVINGEEMTFKYEASQLRRDCGVSYSTWYIPSGDRTLYNLTYGSHTDFKPEDITKITYSRKTLYERSENSNEK